MSNAVVLLSGGLDSTTCLAIAREKHAKIYAISFDYGQKQASELIAAKKNAHLFQVAEHRIVTLDLSHLKGSALIDSEVKVPEHAQGDAIPVTYVPARNPLFLSIALGYAEVVQARHIYIGANQIDYSNYPDCREAFLKAFEQMANLATKCGVEGQGITIHAPLLMLTKVEIIKLGLSFGVDYQHTVSCYQADEKGFACGRCDSCLYRRQGFQALHVPDPTNYRL